jgi:hypothetical protein
MPEILLFGQSQDLISERRRPGTVLEKSIGLKRIGDPGIFRQTQGRGRFRQEIKDMEPPAFPIPVKIPWPIF